MGVRIPLGPLPRSLSVALAEQPGVLATLSRWRSWVQIPSRALDGRHGTPTGRAAKLKPWCPVGSNPTRATAERPSRRLGIGGPAWL